MILLEWKRTRKVALLRIERVGGMILEEWRECRIPLDGCLGRLGLIDVVLLCCKLRCMDTFVVACLITNPYLSAQIKDPRDLNLGFSWLLSLLLSPLS